MKLHITAKPNARENRVERLDETRFRVFVQAPPHQGRANAAILEALSRHLGIPKSRLSFASGQRSKNKVVELKGS